MEKYATKYNKQAVLLVNLGSPDKPDKQAVKKYLRQFLSDKRVIEVNPIIWRIILNGIILPIRSKKTADLYNQIWFYDKNASPLIYYTQKQSELLSDQLSENIIVDFAMRYGKPSIKNRIKKLQEKGVTNIVVLPMYPQYSATTVASIYDEIYRILKSLRWQPNIIGVPPYYANSNYINAVVKSIQNHIVSLNFKPDVIIASFHGIPQKYFDKGDPYYCHCHKSFSLIKAEIKKVLDLEVKLSFQSRFGPKKWLQPYTTDVLEECAKNGKRNIVIVAPGFPSDCLETLEEINVREKHNFLEKGGKNFSLVPCLNDTKEHINMLYSLSAKYL